MKKRFVVSLMAILALAGCQTKELDYPPQQESKHFTATIEDNFDGAETRTFLDENSNIRWKQGDQVSIFAGSTVNEQYQVTDASDGKTSAGFNKVSGSGFVGGTDIDNNVAFYPYASTAEIAKSGNAYVISDITLPATQNYAEASFGNGAFPMAAVTSNPDDMHLKFKNVLGGLKLQLKGTASISSISITGNQNEVLCGAAAVTVSTSNTPSINLTDAMAKTVTLDCGEGVQLNAETAISFVIALPPMTMEGGFTVVVTDTEGKEMEIKTTKSQTITRSRLLKMPAVNYIGVAKPFTITSNGTTSVSINKSGAPDDIILEYKNGDSDWESYTFGNSIDLTHGETLQFRAGVDGNETFSKSFSDFYNVSVTGSGTITVSGNIMSLLDRNQERVSVSQNAFNKFFYGCAKLSSASELNLSATTLATSCYDSMFANCKSLTTAPELPATTLAAYCYSHMFSSCSGLTTAPELPATSLAFECYSNMFSGCSSLTSAPELPATTLASSCYNRMFYQCTGLTTAPELPATTLAPSCYTGMFYQCTGLTSAPELPATTLANDCYYEMFYYCTKLTTAPELPATSLEKECYSGMFNQCVKLTTAPELPATTLANDCYSSMFYGCRGLTTAPDLPATTLNPSCYYRMFYGCTGLITAPELPATTLTIKCYSQMFVNCSSLNYIKMLATNISASNCLSGWVSGVAATGTFVKNSAATWDVTGISGVPSGWTVLTAIPTPEAVDLGLPSGVKWASFNLGASKPEEYGDYYAWGEIEPYYEPGYALADMPIWKTGKESGYYWSSYKLCMGTIYTITKYCTDSTSGYNGFKDGKTVLNPDDDAAHVNLGGYWRMPTDAEWTELLSKCTWESTSMNGISGQKVTGPNGNSIFLPSAGLRNGTHRSDAGSLVYYWSSTLHSDYSFEAWVISSFPDYVIKSHADRCAGLSIRPVRL